MGTNRRHFLAAVAAASSPGLLDRLLTARLLADDAKQKPNVTSGEVPWLDEVQRAPARLPDDAPKLTPLLVDQDGRRIASVDGWKRRREALVKEWNALLRPLDVRRPKPKFDILEEDKRDGVVRSLVRYESEPGLPVEGYLLRPTPAPASPIPGVVVLHSTVDYTIRQPAGLEGPAEKHFGLKLAQRGMAAFCPRCFLWQGEGSYVEKVKAFQKRHPGSLGMAKMLWDAMRGVDVLAGLPYVDPRRLGAVGHSLGGKEVLYLAAFDERIKVAVSSEGGIGTRFSNWHDVWYLGDAIKRPDFAREHHELLAMVAPRAFLLVGGEPPSGADGDRSWPFIAAARDVYELHGKPIRLGLVNHRKGHAVPPVAEQRIYEWLTAYL